MFQIIRVKLDERVVIFRDGLPVRALGPGRHLVWGSNISEERFQIDAIQFRTAPEVRDQLPESWFSEVSLGSRQRAVLVRDGVPRIFLRPGVHRYWTLDSSVKLVVMSVDDALPELTDELVAILPRKEYVVATIAEHQRGLEYIQGRLTRVLDPGYHAFWTHPEARVSIEVVDMRQEQLTIAGQELLTRDKVTLRLTLSVEFSVVDPAKAVLAASEIRDSVYLAVQLAARDYVGGVMLDELLDGRAQMSTYLLESAKKAVSALGVRIERVGVKDIILPGDMRALLNRVIEAEKQAAANVILRREETAATRSLANTARVMADHPVLLRLKELEAIKEIAERIDKVRIVVGTESLSKILPENLLTGSPRSAGS